MPSQDMGKDYYERRPCCDPVLAKGGFMDLWGYLWLRVLGVYSYVDVSRTFASRLGKVRLKTRFFVFLSVVSDILL